MNKSQRRHRIIQAQRKIERAKVLARQVNPIYLNMNSEQWQRGDECDVSYRVPLGTTLEEEMAMVAKWKSVAMIFKRKVEKQPPIQPKKRLMGFQTPTPKTKRRKKPKFKRAILEVELVGTEL